MVKKDKTIKKYKYKTIGNSVQKKIRSDDVGC
jgi:hypothetical protein